MDNDANRIRRTFRFHSEGVKFFRKICVELEVELTAYFYPDYTLQNCKVLFFFRCSNRAKVAVKYDIKERDGTKTKSVNFQTVRHG